MCREYPAPETSVEGTDYRNAGRVEETITGWWVPPCWQQEEALASVRSDFGEKRHREQLEEGCDHCQTIVRKEEGEAKAFPLTQSSWKLRDIFSSCRMF